MKNLIETCIDIIIPSNKNNINISISNEQFDQIQDYFKIEEGRKYFAQLLSLKRSKPCLSEESYEILWKLIKLALIQSDIYK